MTSPDTEGRKLRGVQVCGTLGELEERAGRERLDQKLEKRWVSMGRALNAKLKEFGLQTYVGHRKPLEGSAVCVWGGGGVCILNCPWPRVEDG